MIKGTASYGGVLFLVWVNVVLWILTSLIAILLYISKLYWKDEVIFSLKFLLHFHAETHEVQILGVDCWCLRIVSCLIPRRKAGDVVHIHATRIFLWFLKHWKIYWGLSTVIQIRNYVLLSYIMVWRYIAGWFNLFFLKMDIQMIHFCFHDFKWCWGLCFCKFL